MNQAYFAHVEARAALGAAPLPLDAGQTRTLVDYLLGRQHSDIPAIPRSTFVQLLGRAVPGGVSESARIKAEFLASIVRGDVRSPDLPVRAMLDMLAHMGGGYGVAALAGLLTVPDQQAASTVADALGAQFAVLDVFDDVDALRRAGHRHARAAMEGWAAARWFREAPGEIVDGWTRALRVFKVDGETTTDDLSPARHAGTRADIPLHARAMGEKRFPGGLDALALFEEDALAELTEEQAEDDLERHLRHIAYVGDVVGTGSSRKSAANSLLWHIGRDAPGLVNKRTGGVVIGARIAPIFRDTWLDAGGLPIVADVDRLHMGDRVTLELAPRGHGLDGCIRAENGDILDTFTLPAIYADAFRAGGRVNLVIGKKTTARARAALGLPPSADFHETPAPARKPGVGFTLAQKIVGRACGRDGVVPGEACEPAMATVGSQDTTGPMTRDELLELACLKFSAGLVMQSFCHTAAYPTPADRDMHRSLAQFMVDRGGLALKPGDGIIHAWLNRLLVPDTVGTGGDSHTRFPMGISFAAGSGLVAFAAAYGSMPLEMPESVLVRFSGRLPPGLTVRDAVNAVALRAVEAGLSDPFGTPGGRNVFNGRVMEMEGWDGLDAGAAFELTCASAERNASAATVRLPVDVVAATLRDNVRVLKSMLADGYQSADALTRRIDGIEAWLAAPSLLARDENAEFAATLDVDLSAIREPVLACPNNPDQVARLSAVAGAAVDEVFIGSCMTRREHFARAAELLEKAGKLGVKRCWIAPPTRLDHDALAADGVLGVFERLGARIEIPGCSLCMGNQARVEDGATVVSTSTRNFDNRMGAGARVYLASAELAAVAAAGGRLPTGAEYFGAVR